jgi:hypothetical protein
MVYPSLVTGSVASKSLVRMIQQSSFGMFVAEKMLMRKPRSAQM